MSIVNSYKNQILKPIICEHLTIPPIPRALDLIPRAPWARNPRSLALLPAPLGRDPPVPRPSSPRPSRPARSSPRHEVARADSPACLPAA
ncbi:MAG: hypothetical protein RSB39_08145, partial [Oscillospiraceae bacterium]